MKLPIMQFICKSTVTFYLLGPNIFLSIIFSKTLSLYSSFDMKKKFHTHTKQQAILRFLFVLMFIFLDVKGEDRRFWTEW
jgi:hypothetical protein